jgi:multidrug efflux pump subunit AcrB
LDLTRFALERRVVTGAAVVVLVFMGLQAFFNLPRSEDPGFVIRVALVTTYFPGASPERVEELVTDKLEKAIQEIPEIDFISSQSKTGVSILYVNVLERYKVMRPIWDNLRRKVERASRELPEGVSGPFVNDEFGDVFGILIGLTGEGYDYAELKDVADQVRDQLLRLDDVAKVEISGAQEERIFVEYNNARLAELGLSPGQLRSILESRNIIIPGGSVTVGPERISLEPSGNFESVEDLSRAVISLPGRRDLVYLGDLARITRGYIDPPSAKMFTNGVPSLGVAVSLREGGDISRLGIEVDALLGRLRTAYPIGVDFEVLNFQPRTVDGKVRDFVVNLLQAVGIVMLVMLLMLGLRTGLVVASLIPTTMILSFLVMSILGIGLDQMSLASLIIALGMLVDNAIVMSESIMVRMAAGRPPAEAALRSAHELRIPLLTSSLTTAAAFLPIYLAKSSTGEYTAPLFKVVTIALLCSWLLALTVTPLLCVTFLRVKGNPEAASYDSPFYRRYRAMLLRALRHPWLSLGAVVGLLLVAFLGLGQLPFIFFPPSDKSTFTVALEMPLGTSIERTEEVAREVNGFIDRELRVSDERDSGVTRWGTWIGEGAPKFELSYNPEPPSPNYAFLLVRTTAREALLEMIPRLEAFARGTFPDLEVTAHPLGLGPPIEIPIEVRLSGDDTETLFGLVDRVRAHLRSIPGTKAVRDNWGLRTKKLVVRIDEARALRAGVTNEDVAVSLQTMLSGIQTTQFREADKVIPVTLRSVAADRQDLGKLETLNVYSQATGRSVPLKQVADVEVAWEPSRIYRRDRLRTVTVESDVETGTTAAAVTAQVLPWLEEESRGWDLGYVWELGGENETSTKANESIMVNLPLVGLIILMLLVWQFNSLVKPAIILLTIPLSLIGVSFGLLVARQYMGFMPFLGVISLAGIVINNAIVLIDRIGIEIDENGLEPAKAVIEAAQRRLRPILLTTATTVGGLLPLWLGGGAMWEAMAVAIIFGLLFATGLTLGVVPILYSLFYRVRY